MKWLGQVFSHWVKPKKQEPDPMLTVQEDLYVKRTAKLVEEKKDQQRSTR